MIVLGALIWLVILAIYGAILTALTVWFVLLHRRRGLSFRETDGSYLLFALHVIVVAMVVFPDFEMLLYVPFSTQIGERDVVFKPRLIDDGSISCLVAAGLALLVAIAFRQAVQRPHRVTRG